FLFLFLLQHPILTLFPYTTLFRSFLVANIGGALTPIGDPPLFLGFLRGVPFFWTLTHIWYIWLPTTLLLLAIFFIIDSRNKEARSEEHTSELQSRENLVCRLLLEK